MGKVGIFLLGGFIIIMLARALKPGFDALYNVMNTTVTLSASESMIWRGMPYIIPVVLWAILVFYVSGRINIDGE